MAGPPLIPSYVSQLRCKQGIYNIAALAGSFDGRGRVIWAGEERCFEPILPDAATCLNGSFWLCASGAYALLAQTNGYDQKGVQ